MLDREIIALSRLHANVVVNTANVVVNTTPLLLYREAKVLVERNRAELAEDGLPPRFMDCEHGGSRGVGFVALEHNPLTDRGQAPSAFLNPRAATT